MLTSLTDHNRFFVVRPPNGRYGRRFAHGECVAPVNTGEFPECPMCNVPIGMRSWLPPRTVRLSSMQQKKVADFIWGAGFSFLVSERVAKACVTKNIKGMHVDVEKVQVLPPSPGNAKTEALSGKSLPNYYSVSIHWPGASLDKSQTQVTKTGVTCSYCQSGHLLKIDKIAIDLESWDGSHIFYLRELPGFIIASQEFKLNADEFSWSGLHFIPVEVVIYNEMTGIAIQKID